MEESTKKSTVSCRKQYCTLLYLHWLELEFLSVSGMRSDLVGGRKIQGESACGASMSGLPKPEAVNHEQYDSMNRGGHYDKCNGRCPFRY